LKEELILVLVIGIIIPILFTPILIDAIESDEYTNGVTVEFTYPKNFSNLKSDIEVQLNELFPIHTESIIDSAIRTSEPTDSELIELFVTDELSVRDSISIEVFHSNDLQLKKQDVILDESF